MDYIFQILGVIIIIGACNNWNWYWKNKYGQFFIRIFGQRGARYSIIVIAITIIIFGMYVLLGPDRVWINPTYTK